MGSELVGAITWRERRHVPVIKRLSMAAVLILLLGMVAGSWIDSRITRERIAKVAARQQQIVDTLQGFQTQVAQGHPITQEQLQAAINGLQGPQGPRGPVGPPGPPGAPGAATTATSGPTTPSTARPVPTTTTSTTSCALRVVVCLLS